MQNFLSGWGQRPQTPLGLQRLGAPSPDPRLQPSITTFYIRLLARTNLRFLIRIKFRNFVIYVENSPPPPQKIECPVELRVWLRACAAS